MPEVTINQQAYQLEFEKGHACGFTLTLGKERRCRGWRGWLGHTEIVTVGTLQVGPKGTDDALCHEQQGIFARAKLHIQTEWQGQGLGTYLLKEGIRVARKDGIILAGSLESHDTQQLEKWFLNRGMDIVNRNGVGAKPNLWVLGRKARAAQPSVIMTRLVLADSQSPYSNWCTGT